MAKAQKLPSGNWRCRATVTDEDGVKHTVSFTAETARKAETLAKMWQEGMYQKARSRSSMTLDEAMEQYIETCRCAGMSPATIQGYGCIRRNAFPELKGRPIDRLTIRDIQASVNNRSRTVKPKTIKNEVGMLTAVLRQNGVKLDFDALRLPQTERKEMSIPSDVQISAMLSAVYDDDDMYIAIMLAAVMGLRRSEICALTWDDIIVHGDQAWLNVDKALVRGENGDYTEKSPKTKSGYRKLSIPSSVLGELLHRRNLRPRMIGVSPNVITERYNRLTKTMKISGRFHDLRHYHASVMLREGVPEKYIVADMGHASFDMVRNVYGHVMEEKQLTINSMMDAHASSIVESCHKNCHAK